MLTVAVRAQVAKPSIVTAAEQTSSPATDDEVLSILTAFNIAVGKVSRTVRHLLPEHGGYECKEPEPGKFTLAFKCGPCPQLCSHRSASCAAKA